MSKPNDVDEPLLTVKEAAARIAASVKTIRRRIESGELAVIRDGRMVRIRPEDLRRYISRRRFG